jgi:uncharacterized cupredoxin-like copper-binding protein
MALPSLGRSGLSRAAVCAALVAALATTSGCASGPPSARSAGTVVRVAERDFQISVAPTHLRAGEIVLSVHNEGPEKHELIVVREGDHALPFRKDGVTVDEDALTKVQVGSLEPGPPGSVRNLKVTLRAGRYDMFCNMAGHFLGGMHTELVVS